MDQAIGSWPTPVVLGPDIPFYGPEVHMTIDLAPIGAFVFALALLLTMLHRKQVWGIPTSITVGSPIEALLPGAPR